MSFADKTKQSPPLLESVDLSDSDDRDRVRTAVFDLHEHIAKEEEGCSPPH